MDKINILSKMLGVVIRVRINSELHGTNPKSVMSQVDFKTVNDFVDAYSYIATSHIVLLPLASFNKLLI